MKGVAIIGWISAGLGIASWMAFFAVGTVAMSEGGLAFVGTLVMLILYAVPVGFHFLAILLGLKKNLMVASHCIRFMDFTGSGFVTNGAGV